MLGWSRNRPIQHLGDRAHLPEQLFQLRGEDRLRAVGARLLGVVMHFHHQAVAATATAARESGITLLRLPVPWLGSTRMGRWLSR